MIKTTILIALFLGWSGTKTRLPGPPDGFCGIKNTTTQNGEEISFSVYYALAGVHVNAGWAKFSNKTEKLAGHTVYHITGAGASYTNYDWMYRVRDRYDTYIDTGSMLPLKFTRQVEEGKTRKNESITFNHTANTAKTDSTVYKVPPCIQDVLSSIYYARNIDFNKYKKGEKIPFRMFLENETHELYIRYLGKTTIKTKFGKFKAICFKPLLVEGTIFSGGENMTVWVTDDLNHIPVRIESQILIGSIKVDMTDYKGLKWELTSLEKKK